MRISGTSANTHTYDGSTEGADRAIAEREREATGPTWKRVFGKWNGEHTAVDGLVQSISSRTISAEYYQSILLLRITRRPS